MNAVSRWFIGTGITVITALTIGGFTLASMWSQQSKEFGKIEADNQHLSTQNAELRQQNASLRERLDDMVSSSSTSNSNASRLQEAAEDNKARLSEAYSLLESLQKENSRLTFLADSAQRCAPFRTEIERLQNALTGQERFSMGQPPGAERKAEINSHIIQQHESLRACLSAKP